MPLLLLVVLCHFGPEAMQGHGTVGAWQYVFTDIESALLWLVMLVITPNGPYALVVRGACAWSAVEHGMRAACRPAFSMFSPPPPVNLCDAATGFDTSSLAVLAALGLALCANYVGAHRASNP